MSKTTKGLSIALAKFWPDIKKQKIESRWIGRVADCTREYLMLMSRKEILVREKIDKGLTSGMYLVTV